MVTPADQQPPDRRAHASPGGWAREHYGFDDAAPPTSASDQAATLVPGGDGTDARAATAPTRRRGRSPVVVLAPALVLTAGAAGLAAGALALVGPTDLPALADSLVAFVPAETGTETGTEIGTEAGTDIGTEIGDRSDAGGRGAPADHGHDGGRHHDHVRGGR